MPPESSSAPASQAPRVPWLELIVLFISSRLLFITIAWLSRMIVVHGNFFEGKRPLLESFFLWDSIWFTGIVKDGYGYDPAGQSSIAFFPLYPILMWVFKPLFGGDIAYAGIFVSNAALFGSVVLLWKLAEDIAAEGRGGLQPGDGIKVSRLLLFTPVTFFHSIVYSEATFLFMSVACVYAARRRNWGLAALAGYLAALTRNAGMLLVIPMLVEYFDIGFRKPFFRRDVSWVKALACFAPALGFATWAAYLGWKFGDPRLVLKVQSAWDRELTLPWATLLNRGDDFYRGYWFPIFGWAAVAMLAICIIGRLRLSLVLLAGAALWLNLSGKHLEAIPRLTSVIFPLYFAWVLLARRWPALEPIILAGSGALLAFSTILFVNGYWFT